MAGLVSMGRCDPHQAGSRVLPVRPTRAAGVPDMSRLNFSHLAYTGGIVAAESEPESGSSDRKGIGPVAERWLSVLAPELPPSRIAAIVSRLTTQRRNAPYTPAMRRARNTNPNAKD